MKKIIKKKKENPTALLFVGSLMIGMGLGFYYGNLVVGLFLGLGVGFILMFIAEIFCKNKK